MPFKSYDQLLTCYKKNDPRWDCDKWLKETIAYALSNHELEKMMNNQIKVVIYPDLVNYNSIEELLEPFGAVIILYLMDTDTGHWVTLFRYPNSNKIEFFDPYGRKPDYGLKLIPIIF